MRYLSEHEPKDYNPANRYLPHLPWWGWVLVVIAFLALGWMKDSGVI